jgi:hypothetical protein
LNDIDQIKQEPVGSPPQGKFFLSQNTENRNLKLNPTIFFKKKLDIKTYFCRRRLGYNKDTTNISKTSNISKICFLSVNSLNHLIVNPLPQTKWLLQPGRKHVVTPGAPKRAAASSESRAKQRLNPTSPSFLSDTRLGPPASAKTSR